MDWKYCVIRKMKPNRVKNETVTDPLAAVNRRFRNRRISSIGCAARRSRQAKSAPRTAVPAKPAALRADPQPYAGASMMVKTSKPAAAVDNSRPLTSSRSPRAGFEAGTAAAASRMPAAATGPIATKMLDQLKCSSSQPPSVGPGAIATPPFAPHSPIARARSARPVKTLEISDSVAGNVIAAPRPMTARAAISQDGLDAKLPATLAAPNTARPASSMPLRPIRSDSAPQGSSSSANTRLYASTTHCSCEVVACSSRTRVGSATLTSVVSRLMTNAASSRAARIIGFDRIVEILKFKIDFVKLELLKIKYGGGRLTA